MNYAVSELVTISDGKLLQGEGKDHISRVYIDSRKIWKGDNSCFIALKGVNFNAHEFIRPSYENGVRVFIVSEEQLDLDEFGDASFILVKNTTKALQSIAKDHRRKFDFPLIGITGSNGKTTVKEWLAQCLNEKYSVVKTPKSYNSQVGVPLSVFQIGKKHDIGIFEAGISHTNEMQFLADILDPDIGIFTNIGNAHAEYFEDDLQKAQEKVKLFRNSKTLVYSIDDPIIAKVVKDLDADKLGWSENGQGAINFSFKKEGLYHGTFKNEDRIFELPFSDPASKQNLFHVVTLLWHLGYSENEVNDELKEIQHVQMRLESVEGMSNSLFINDVYNSDLTSLEAAIEIFKNENTRPDKQLILSDIKNTGYTNRELSNMIKDQIVGVEISTVHLIGENAKEYQSAFNGSDILCYDNTEDLLDSISSLDLNNSTILIKGSRSFKLERIAEKFQKKTHKTILEVNLSALLENLNYYRSKLEPGVKLAIMVKAFSYGSGLHEIAALLEKNNVDQLAVAYTDEGVALREKNIGLPIMVMNPEDAPPETLIEYRLEPVVYSWETFDHFSDVMSELPIHIKVDTGMNRLGFHLEDIETLVERMKDQGAMVASVFTHLSASEDPDEDMFTNAQFNAFENIRSAFHEFDSVRFHALNSSGIGRFPDKQMDMVRLGIGLYGYSGAQRDMNFLQPAISLKSTITQVKSIAEGESVGYSRAFRAPKDMSVGVVPIGYADGIHRAFGNGNGSVLINGRSAFVIGNICMDMCMIDLSGIECKVGDEVEFFGANKPLAQTASEMGTIPYEVLANISQRVKRTFYFD
ncbi:MAG: bifunctional UDP-N-acetylmuramoyl-tripeptide:D-alanyl-D-alanine ligase/alanine racemase [Flavobacteriales bacterium]|nr:bifunctional UDP-N-acetylmuramoyl-tripeptide:D-alanyl-D-alanine ligase/alanine racemase [Flavobacteriales bacterium]